MQLIKPNFYAKLRWFFFANSVYDIHRYIVRNDAFCLKHFPEIAQLKFLTLKVNLDNPVQYCQNSASFINKFVPKKLFHKHKQQPP